MRFTSPDFFGPLFPFRYCLLLLLPLSFFFLFVSIRTRLSKKEEEKKKRKRAGHKKKKRKGRDGKVLVTLTSRGVTDGWTVHGSCAELQGSIAVFCCCCSRSSWFDVADG